MDVARAIFGHVFLNVTDDEDIRQRALRAAALMKVWFDDEIKRRRASGNLGTDMMGALMAAKRSTMTVCAVRWAACWSGASIPPQVPLRKSSR